jgi:lipid-binding SYLF domain-containing protein
MRMRFNRLRGVHRFWLPLWLFFGSLAVPAIAVAESNQEKKMDEVIEVIETIRQIPEVEVPPALVKDAQGIAVIPNVIKVGLVVGGRYGKGVLSVKREDGSWSDPVFISIAGGSVGWQIGAQSSDIVLVFKTRKSIEGLTKGKFTLAADAGVAAGPVGRQAAAGTDVQLKAEIYSYSRSRGLFAGVSLDGAVMDIHDEANAVYYRSFDVTPDQILAGQVPRPPASAEALRNLLAEYERDTRDLYPGATRRGGGESQGRPSEQQVQSEKTLDQGQVPPEGV